MTNPTLRGGLRAAALIVAAIALRPFAEPGFQAQTAFPCDVQTTERVVAVGDVHGAYESFVAILRAANLIDSSDRWIGQKAVLVQTGDVVDRGGGSRKAIDLIRKLEREAERAGGRVYALLGNHELMRLVDDWRYVSAGEYDAFKSADSVEFRERAYAVVSANAQKQAAASAGTFDANAFREQFLKEVPLGYLEMRQAFSATGDYGKWVRSRPAVARINGIVFMHGGVGEATAPLGCEGIDDRVLKDLGSLPVPPDKVATLFAAWPTGPLWYRGLATEPEDKLSPSIDTLLAQMHARAFVLGHSTVLPGRITTRLGGRVVLIDTGMVAGTFYPGGVASALELQGATATAIYLDRREPLVVEALKPRSQK